ncbi:MAG TPA: hypothetical protein VMA36_10830 [Candidatus Limnocylindria bacterium]|nr:hypothetical protein [Candidatus Limnocylindria bacterium]
MQLFDQLFGRREQRWFENGQAAARQGKFQGQVVAEGRKISVLGTTVSREGVAFVSPLQLAVPELAFTFTLRERTIPSRVRLDKSEAMQAPERIVHRYFCTFVAIAADDWDAVVRYVEDKPEPKKVDLAPKIDEEFRALPVAVQSGIVEHLVRAKRLAPPTPGTVPLIRLTAGSIRDAGNGRTTQDVLIHSRILVEGVARAYDTRFRIFSNLRIELIG